MHNCAAGENAALIIVEVGIPLLGKAAAATVWMVVTKRMRESMRIALRNNKYIALTHAVSE